LVAGADRQYRLHHGLVDVRLPQAPLHLEHRGSDLVDVDGL